MWVDGFVAASLTSYASFCPRWLQEAGRAPCKPHWRAVLTVKKVKTKMTYFWTVIRVRLLRCACLLTQGPQ
jgi:hypothetical protein